MTRRQPASPLAALRLVMAALAVIGQLLIGALVPASAATPDAATLLGIPDAICHATGAPDVPGSQPVHHGVDCALCPLCFALAPIAALPNPPAPLPDPAVAFADPPTPSIAISTVPPARASKNPPPRGPPGLA